MCFKIIAQRVDNYRNLIAALLHELEDHDVHLRDCLNTDPKGFRKAIRHAIKRMEFKGVSGKDNEETIRKMARIFRKRRIPPGRTAASATELRKNGGYKGIINPPPALQAILQALPDEYFIREQDAFFKAVWDWLEEKFPGAIFMGTIHGDKMRLHVEFVILKYDKHRKLLDCFKRFKHDGPGVTANRANDAIHGKKHTEEEKAEMKINSLAAIHFSMNMRQRLLGYLREMGPALRRKTLREAREMKKVLANKSWRGSEDDWRPTQKLLKEARAEYAVFCQEEKKPAFTNARASAGGGSKNASISKEEDGEKLEPNGDFDEKSLVPMVGDRPNRKNRDADKKKQDGEKPEQIPPIVSDAQITEVREKEPDEPRPFNFFNINTSQQCEKPNKDTIHIELVDEFWAWKRKQDFQVFARSAHGDIEEIHRKMLKAYLRERELGLTESLDIEKGPEPN